MALSAAGRAEQQQVGALLQPASPAAMAMTWALEIIGTASKANVSRVLPGRQAGFGEMPLDAAAVTFGQFMLGDGGQEAGRGPAFLVGLLGELRPHVA